MHATRFSSHSTGARRYPLSYVFSGYYDWNGTGSLGTQDSNGFWWSAMTGSDGIAYLMYINNSTIGSRNGNHKAIGQALCCVPIHLHLCPSVSAFVCIFRIL
ncbi:hypothetical protein IK112_02135 [Candidatus Saccharibacteria bacterium]|nr:hypothetical protein [Candidatus Saccharibacteria bacterium]